MRTSRYQPVNPPKDIHFLETLNVFGVQADFMATFRDFLENEGLPPNDAPSVEFITLNVTHDFGVGLKILRPKARRDSQEQYDFRKHGPVLAFSVASLPPGLTTGALVVVDRYPRLQMLQAVEVGLGKVEAAQPATRHFDRVRLNLLDWNALLFDLERLRRQRHWDNLLLRRDALRPLLELQDWYQVLAPDALWRLTMGNVRHWQSMALELLAAALERTFKPHKRAYLDPRMDLAPLQRGHDNFPPEGESYQLVVEAGEAWLLDDIRQLKEDLARVGWRDSGHVRGLRFGAHLYEPLLYSEKVRIQPVALNKSEFAFVNDLRVWLEKHEAELAEAGQRLFLLRNLSRKGVGFFEAGGFYPYFILWCLFADGRPHQSLEQKTPEVVYRTAVGGGAMILDKFGGAVEESPDPLRSSEDSSTAEASSKAAATTKSKAKSKAKPGQRRPAATEIAGEA